MALKSGELGYGFSGIRLTVSKQCDDIEVRKGVELELLCPCVTISARCTFGGRDDTLPHMLEFVEAV